MAPAKRMAKLSRVVATGRRINGAEMCIVAYPGHTQTGNRRPLGEGYNPTILFQPGISDLDSSLCILHLSGRGHNEFAIQARSNRKPEMLPVNFQGAQLTVTRYPQKQVKSQLAKSAFQGRDHPFPSQEEGATVRQEDWCRFRPKPLSDWTFGPSASFSRLDQIAGEVWALESPSTWRTTSVWDANHRPRKDPLEGPHRRQTSA